MLHTPTASTLVFATWFERVLSSGCEAVPPLALPITDIQINSSITNSFMRGVPLTIGTPAQSIVVLPWPDLNNTYIYDEQSNCDSSIIWNEQICEIRRGGYFLETESTSFNKCADLIAAGGAPSELNTRGSELGVSKLLSTSLAGTEALTTGLNSTKTLTMPIGIPRLRWDNGYTMLHAMGMGSNSTFLNALVTAGQVSSRVWSIWWGRMWTDTNAMDGSLVLGGYDTEKVTGRNITLPLDYTPESGCWTGMKVSVSNLLINFRNGTDVGILPRDSALRFCIVPQRQLLMEAPGSVVDTFQNATKMTSIGTSFGLHWNSRLLNNTSGNDIFDGDVTFVLNDGLNIRVPNSQFLVPFVDVDRRGVRNVDRSKKELVMFGVGEEPATLGRYFLTAAYLMVNHDARTFTMWQANPTTKSSLTTVQRKGPQAQDCEGSGGGDVDATGGASDQNTNNSGDSSTPLNTGMIAGGAVGGVVVIAAVLMAFFFLRRRKRRSVSREPEAVLPPGYDQTMASTDGIYMAGRRSPQEIAGSFPSDPNKIKPAELQTEAQPVEVYGSYPTDEGQGQSGYQQDDRCTYYELQ